MAEERETPTYSERLWLIPVIGIVLRIGVWIYCISDIRFLVTHKLPDDALYYFTAARSFAAGHGITFDGIHPTNGLHPLWLLLISPIWRFGLSGWSAIHAVLLVQSLLDGIVIWLIGKLIVNELFASSRSNRLSAARMCQLLYACSPIVVISAINGLETTLAALLLLLWLTLYLRLPKASTLTAFAVLGFCSGLLLLARTDSIVILLPVVAVGLYHRSIRPMQLLILSLVTAVVILPWLIWNIATFGTILQSSAQAVPYFAMKKYHAIYGSWMYLHLVLEAIRNIFKPFVYSTFGLSIATIAFAILRSKMSDAHSKVLWMLLGALLLLAIHSLFRGFVREWYVEQLIPLFLVAFGISIGLNSGKSEARPAGRYVLAGLIVCIMAIFSRPHFASQEAVLEKGVPLVHELTVHSKVASLNSGFYSYFASQAGSVVNLDGVVNPLAFAHISHSDLGHYLESDSVEYVLDFQGDLGGYIGLVDPRLLNGYTLDSTIESEDKANPLLLFHRSNLVGIPK